MEVTPPRRRRMEVTPPRRRRMEVSRLFSQAVTQGEIDAWVVRNTERRLAQGKPEHITTGEVYKLLDAILADRQSYVTR